MPTPSIKLLDSAERSVVESTRENFCARNNLELVRLDIRNVDDFGKAVAFVFILFMRPRIIDPERAIPRSILIVEVAAI